MLSAVALSAADRVREHRPSGRVRCVDRAGGGRTAVSALGLREETSLRLGEQPAALPLSRLRLKS